MKVAIHLVGGTGTVFDLEDVKRIREEHQILGTLSGVLPQIPQQNVFLGLPLTLMPEDVAYLVYDIKEACLIDDRALHEQLLLNTDPKAHAAMMEVRAQQSEARATSHALAAWDKRHRALIKANIQVSDSAKDEFLADYDRQSAASVVIQTDSKGLPCYSDLERSFECHNFKVNDKAYKLYKSLKEEGFWLSPGLRFGGLFVAYPGDPLRFHSHHIAVAFDWNEEIPVIDIVCGGRLGTSVKKSWLVGSEDPSTNKTRHFSVEWAGFG